MNYKKKHILCAAIWYDDGEKHKFQPQNITIGFVLGGLRHQDIENCP